MDDLRLHNFKLGKVTHEYSRDEDIFKLACHHKGKIKLPECYSCRHVSFAKEKEMNFCEFCTRANCKNCMLKTRAYPMA